MVSSGVIFFSCRGQPEGIGLQIALSGYYSVSILPAIPIWHMARAQSIRIETQTVSDLGNIGTEHECPNPRIFDRDRLDTSGKDPKLAARLENTC